MMKWHLIEGEAGCAYAVRHHCVAIIVDALRASATAAMLLDAGALELIVVREVAGAFAARVRYPRALLFGERGGLPPEGFDYGNSPRDAAAAKGRQVIFTTTTGAQRLAQAWGALAVYMGTTLNASAVAKAAESHHADVVVIPAGLAGHPDYDAQEDWVAATVIANAGNGLIEHGAERHRLWSSRIAQEGVKALFESAPHAANLRNAGLAGDIPFCAQIDITAAVPTAVMRTEDGLIVRNGG